MLEVAMEIVAEQGLEALTIARLAKALDAAVGALYRYFPSKDALLVQLQVQALEDFHVDLTGEMQAAEKRLSPCSSATERSLGLMRILLMMQFYMDDAIRAPQRHRLMYAFLSTLEPSLSEEGAQEGGRVVAKILKSVQENLATALGLDDEVLIAQWTHVLWATLHGLDHFRKRDRIQPAPLQTPQLLPIAQRSLFLGWGIAPEVVEAGFVCFEQVCNRPATLH
jgi:AcrR family transcriptional regulator